MTFTKSRAALAISLTAGMAFLAACAPEGGDYMESVALTNKPLNTATASCGANQMGWLIGQPESTLAAVSIAGPVAVILAGEGAPSGSDPSRLNVNMDINGRIASLTCG